jgi:hypothetical protein
MAAKVPTIKCANCDGSGQVELTPANRETYAKLTHDWQATSVLAEKIGGVMPTALVNRLTFLEKHGLAVARLCPTNFRVKEWRRT